MFTLLAKLGCGHIMLRMYKTIKNILKTAIINPKIGIKPGGVIQRFVVHFV